MTAVESLSKEIFMGFSQPVKLLASQQRKILLMGYKGHGKNLVCWTLAKTYGLQYQNAGVYYAKAIIFPKLALKYGYKNELECWQDRNEKSKEWFQLIREYNAAHPARTGCKIWSEVSVYSGLLDVDEYRVLKARKMFDHSLWVNGNPRVEGQDSREVITVGPQHAEHVIHNSSTRSQLVRSLDEIMERLGIKPIA